MIRVEYTTTTYHSSEWAFLVELGWITMYTTSELSPGQWTVRMMRQREHGRICH